MAMYLAKGLEENRFDYFRLFSISRYLPLKADVDAMLIADGFQDLIVPIA
jgi:hypothetical protein